LALVPQLVSRSLRGAVSGLRTLTSGAPVLPDGAVDLFAFSGGQAEFEASVDVALP
jgi:hypothetical protein